VNVADNPAASAAGRFEMYSWLFMRVSGIVLLVMAVFHLLLMHYGVGVDQLNYQVVASRWGNPWWRLYDGLFALTHGMNGARILMDEYLRAGIWRLFLKIVLSLLYLLLVVMGAWVIVTFG
jgi:succinate dehydrogenase / fumarate reductase membrane anchor subunit